MKDENSIFFSLMLQIQALSFDLNEDEEEDDNDDSNDEKTDKKWIEREEEPVSKFFIVLVQYKMK